jgi:hypothetical protein
MAAFAEGVPRDEQAPDQAMLLELAVRNRDGANAILSR